MVAQPDPESATTHYWLSSMTNDHEHNEPDTAEQHGQAAGISIERAGHNEHGNIFDVYNDNEELIGMLVGSHDDGYIFGDDHAEPLDDIPSWAEQAQALIAAGVTT